MEIGDIIEWEGKKLIAAEAEEEGYCDGCYLRGKSCSDELDCGDNIILKLADAETTDNNGGSTDYYKLPANATELQDLIEHKDMSFSVGNIFKASYRLGECNHSDKVRDLNKIIWFAQRELNKEGKQ